MLDVERWLSAVEPAAIDGWLAFDKLERDSDIELKRLIEIVKLGFAAVCAAWGKQIEPDDLDPMPEEREEECIGPGAARAMVGLK